MLIAEDSWIIAESIKQVLIREGAVISGPAGTIEEARALAARGPYDCAVFDLNLGGQLTTDVVAELAARGVGVVVLSGYTVDPALRAKVAACLEKPVTDEEIVAALEACGER